MYIFLSLNFYFAQYFKMFLVSNPDRRKLEYSQKIESHQCLFMLAMLLCDFSKVNLCGDCLGVFKMWGL